MTDRGPQQAPALLVDVGGVLLLHNHELLAPITARYGGVSDRAGFQRAHYGAHNQSLPARGPAVDYFSVFPSHAGIPEAHREAFEAEYRAYHQTRNMCHWPDPNAKHTLRTLKDEGVPIAVVSQADGTIVQMLREAQMCQEGEGPGVSVDAILDSAVVGYDKPDPRLFLAALERIGAEPARAVHVGDTVYADVMGARAAGILPLHYDPFDDCDDRADHDHIRHLGEVRPYLERVTTTA